MEKFSDRKNLIDSSGDIDRTKKRLDEIQALGLTECGTAEFGIEGLMSGLYIEKIWSYNDQDWNGYMDWIKSLKKVKHFCICMTCGIRNDQDNPDSLCRNGHDDWLELRDFSHLETGAVLKATKVFKTTYGQLYEAFINPEVKGLHRHP